MLFSSPIFLFLFLPILVSAYFLVRPGLLNSLLLLASLVFYIWGEGHYVLVMLAIIAVNYALGRLLEHLERPRLRRAILAAGVVVNLGILIAFKYANFLVDNLDVLLAALGLPAIRLAPVHLPLGISFFTFHAISYIVDISPAAGAPAAAARLRAVHGVLPALDRRPDRPLQRHRRPDPRAGRHDARVRRGGAAVHLGLAKKMLIANTLAGPPTRSSACPAGELTAGLAWLGVACYTLQIYFDFSGYSDMAIGLAKLFGFDFLENFDIPTCRGR